MWNHGPPCFCVPPKASALYSFIQLHMWILPNWTCMSAAHLHKIILALYYSTIAISLFPRLEKSRWRYLQVSPTTEGRYAIVTPPPEELQGLSGRLWLKLPNHNWHTGSAACKSSRSSWQMPSSHFLPHPTASSSRTLPPYSDSWWPVPHHTSFCQLLSRLKQCHVYEQEIMSP